MSNQPKLSNLDCVKKDKASVGSTLLALMEEKRPAAFWSMQDLAERARALAEHLPLSCEDPAWVALIRSVREPEAGEIGVDLQSRIGSERVWEEGLAHWRRKLKLLRKAIDAQRNDLSRYAELNLRLATMNRLFVTVGQYFEQSFEDHIWDLDQPDDHLPSPEEIARSKREAFESGRNWRAAIDHNEHNLHQLEIEFKIDGEFLGSYCSSNCFLIAIGGSKLTRAEFVAMNGLSFDPDRHSRYRALYGSFAHSNNI